MLCPPAPLCRSEVTARYSALRLAWCLAQGHFSRDVAFAPVFRVLDVHVSNSESQPDCSNENNFSEDLHATFPVMQHSELTSPGLLGPNAAVLKTENQLHSGLQQPD